MLRIGYGRGRARRRLASRVAVAALLPAAFGGATAFAQPSYLLFESVPVRPLALNADTTLLFAANTHDGRVEIFGVGGDGSLTSTGEVQVGLEPVAIAARGNDEIWVTNHLSDSVSRVDVSDPANPRVTDTILVGDEPRDVVLGGSAGDRVFVACARRGQNRPSDPQLTTPGVGRADIWVIDADDPAAAPSIVTLFGDTPRALAVSPDGAEVYAAVLNSGNGTVTITEDVVTANGGSPPPPPGSRSNPPDVGLIVKLDGTEWVDEIGRDWSFAVPFTLPDRDVFVLDANADPPVETGFVTGVGSALFNMAVNPASGDLYVTGQEARNHIRFEPVIGGHLAEQNVTIIDGTTPVQVHLNAHIDYGAAGTPVERAQSVGLPLDIVFEAGGTRAYIASFGSSKVAVIDAAGSVTSRIDVGGGPAGLTLAEAIDRLYVLNSFDGTISVVDTVAGAEIATVELRYDPEPASIRNGRRFLHDTELTSGHGDNSCATCHFSADMDRKAWDLGDPFGAIAANPNPFPVIGSANPFHPMKGPMATQSLRGMADAGSMHWRGDRNGGSGDPLNEDLSFKQFNGAFVSLLGRASALTGAEMQAYTDFILQVRYPPNPVAPLDGTLTAEQADGAALFVTGNHDFVATCEGCHNLPLGTGGFSTFEGESQEFKVAHLRNAYAKIGMFAAAGDQVAETGFLHDGSIAGVFDFLAAPVFSLDDPQQRALEAFMLAFDTGLAPAVGQQVTANAGNFAAAAVTDRIELLRLRDEDDDCELVAKGLVAGVARGALYVDGGMFQPDDNEAAPVAYDLIRQRAATAGQEVTYTCVYPGGGTRLGLDRDEDGFFDRTEIEALSDPADPSSTPTGSLCGNERIDAGEDCDADDLGGETCASLAEGTGTLACDASCSFDVGGCSGGGELAIRVLKLGKLTLPAGEQKIALKSDDIDGSAISFTPITQAVTVTISKDGTPVWEGVIPGGDDGWTLAGSSYKWRAPDAGHADGIKSATIGLAGNLFRVSVKSDDSSATGAAGAASLEVQLVIGDDAFTGSAACTQSSSGKSLKCRGS